MSSLPRRKQKHPDIQPKIEDSPVSQQPNKTPASLQRRSPKRSSHRGLPTLGRRLFAWGLEAAILAASIGTPFYAGGHLNRTSQGQRVELSPVLQFVQERGAQILGVSPRSLPQQVPPLTNLLWTTAFGLPLLLTVGHLYSVSRVGRSWPKRWMGIQVLTLNGQMPGPKRTLMRECVGKWGGPILVAYGVWQLSGAFPVLGVFCGLGVLALMGESLTGLGNQPRRAWHDWLGGTCVVDRETGAIIHFSSLWEAEARHHTSHRGPFASWAHAVGPTPMVMTPIGQNWERSELDFPKVGLGLGLLLIVGGLIGGGSHFLLGRSPLFAANAEETLYANLVSTLTNPDLDPAARRAAVLALGNLPDDRVTPLLVDLIAQTDDPLWLDALQQALVARGPEAFLHLRRLNQSLAADLTMQAEADLRPVFNLRLQTVNRIIAKLLLLEGRDRVSPLDLSRINLGRLSQGNSDFRLVLKNQDLSHVQWQGTVLTQAQFQGSRFYSLGADGHFDTYDDVIADLSGANLTDADLTGTTLSLSQLVNTGLLRATLNGADLRQANLTGANLENASLIQATLDQAEMARVKLARADLTEAQLSSANLADARMAEVSAEGVQMPQANLRGITAQSSNLKGANLNNALLLNADLTGTVLQNVDLRNANLTGVSLRDTDLRGASLQGAILEGADLAGAILTESVADTDNNFVAAVPNLANRSLLKGVDFTTARNLEPEQLIFICAQGGIHPTCSPSTQE